MPLIPGAPSGERACTLSRQLPGPLVLVSALPRPLGRVHSQHPLPPSHRSSAETQGHAGPPSGRARLCPPWPSLCLSCLQLKTILVPKWYTSGQHVHQGPNYSKRPALGRKVGFSENLGAFALASHPQGLTSHSVLFKVSSERSSLTIWLQGPLLQSSFLHSTQLLLNNVVYLCVRGQCWRFVFV